VRLTQVFVPARPKCGMEYQNTPYVYDEVDDDDHDDAPVVEDAPDTDDDQVIVDGRVMSYRQYAAE